MKKEEILQMQLESLTKMVSDQHQHLTSSPVFLQMAYACIDYLNTRDKEKKQEFVHAKMVWDKFCNPSKAMHTELMQ